jgi:hypothetical protein
MGVPLSPLLFLIVAKGLSREINDAKITKALKGIKIGGSIFLSHLFFVDDILLFNDGFKEGCNEAQRNFKCIFHIASMLVNFQKSTLSSLWFR